MAREFAFISACRAVAAFWVLAAHCMIWGGWYGIAIPSPKIAVDLFMIVSGFLMAANAAARATFEPLTEKRHWVTFWLRRFFRIAPAYYLSLLVVFALGTTFVAGYAELQKLSPEQWAGREAYAPTRIDFSIENLLLHLTFVFGLHPEYSSSTFLPDWSLALEMQFYAVFPALLVFMQARGHTWYLRSALVIGGLAAIIGVAFSKHYYEPSLLAFKLQYFIVGMMVFTILHGSVTRRQRLELVAAAAFLVCLELTYKKQLVVQPLMLGTVLALGWMEAKAITPAWLARVMRGRVVRFASDSSYAVYLFHSVFISVAGLLIANSASLRSLEPAERVGVLFVFVFACSYLVGNLIFRFVETPGIGLGKRVIGFLRRRASSATEMAEASSPISSPRR